MTFRKLSVALCSLSLLMAVAVRADEFTPATIQSLADQALTALQNHQMIQAAGIIGQIKTLAANADSYPPSPPPVPSNPTCTMGRSANGFTFMNDNPNIDVAALQRVEDGSMLEILGYETIWYKGIAKNGVRVRVITNANETGSASPGQVLWYYANILNCH